MLKLVFLATALFLAAAQAQHTMVILGSSTAAGTGATNYDSAFAGRYVRYLATQSGGWRLTNLAVGGYTTYHLLPANLPRPGGRPASDTAKNLTKALSLNPDVILFALGSNDMGNGYAPSEYEANYDSIWNIASRAGVRIWVTTPLPRNMDSTGRRKILNMRSRVMTRYAPRAVDFYDTLGLADGSMNPAYNAGDGIHTNDRGHKSLYQRLVTANLNLLPSGMMVKIVAIPGGFHRGLVWDSRTGIISLNIAGSRVRHDMQGRRHY